MVNTQSLQFKLYTVQSQGILIKSKSCPDSLRHSNIITLPTEVKFHRKVKLIYGNIQIKDKLQTVCDNCTNIC